jgi:hypothetical protein
LPSHDFFEEYGSGVKAASFTLLSGDQNENWMFPDIKNAKESNIH